MRSIPPGLIPMVGLCCVASLALASSDARRRDDVEIIADGAHPTAATAARALLAEMQVVPRLRARLAAARIALVVVPRRVAMTAIPQFASLRGQRTFDGRSWDKVRGNGGTHLVDGRFAVAVPEENLLGTRDDPYPTLAVAMHELAHAIHDRVLPEDERAHIQRAYDARLASGAPFVDAYARLNVREYFAQGATIFFGRSTSRTGQAGQAGQDARWLEAQDPLLHAALVRAFGTPPAKRPRGTS